MGFFADIVSKDLCGQFEGGYLWVNSFFCDLFRKKEEKSVLPMKLAEMDGKCMNAVYKRQFTSFIKVSDLI